MRAHVLALVVCTSCVGEIVGVGGPASDLDDATLALLDGYRALTKVNTAPYASDLGEFEVNCYVAGDVASYRRIHPETEGSNAKLAPGTLIVREVLDEAGQVTRLTAMAKGPPGYDPRLGDWWFAVTDRRGVPLIEAGRPLVGRLTQCHDCHRDRARDDFLFGVARADSAP